MKLLSRWKSSRAPRKRPQPRPIALRSGRDSRTRRGRDWRVRATWGLCLGLTVGSIVFYIVGRHPISETLGRQVMDSWFTLRGGQPVRDVTTLDIDEATVERWGGKDFNAPDLARLLVLLKRNRARGTLLVLPSIIAATKNLKPQQTHDLVKALHENGATWIGVDVDSYQRAAAQPQNNGQMENLAVLLDAARGTGHLSVSKASERVRAVPLNAGTEGKANRKGAISQRWQALSFLTQGINEEGWQTALSTQTHWPSTASLLLNYPNAASDNTREEEVSPFPHLSVEEALRSPDALRAVTGQWVVIGSQTHASQSYLTPLGGYVSLTQLQAIALDNLLTDRYLRPSPTTWGWLLVMLPCAVVGGFAAARKPGWSGGVALLCLCGVALMSFGQWEQSIWLNPVPAWSGIILTWIGGGVARARWQERHTTRIDSVVEALTQGSELIAAQKESDQLLPRVLTWAENTLRARGASVLLLDPDGETLRFACATGPKSQELMHVTLKVGQGIAGWVAQNGVPAVVNEAALDWRFDQDVDRRIGFHTRSILCVPLRIRERTIGVIEVVNRRDGQPFDAMDAELLSAVAVQAALVIENAQLYERLEARVEESESELARANARLQAEKTLLQTVLQSMTDGVVVTDRRGRVQLMNAAASALLPELSASALGRPLSDSLPELRDNTEFQARDANASTSAINGAAATFNGSPDALMPEGAQEQGTYAERAHADRVHAERAHAERARRAVLLLRGDVDAPRIIEAHTAPLLGSASISVPTHNGTPPRAAPVASVLGSIVVFSDVTEARNVEQAKSDFVSFVAHEMRSPLTSISGFSSMLLRAEDAARESSPSRTRFMSIIRDESERLTRLINNLLDVARIEAGRGVDISREAWDVAPVIEAAAESQRSYSSRHRIVCEIDPQLPPVFADRDKVSQVLINLVSNALKYSPGGIVTVRAIRSQAENAVAFCVSDQGPGIAPEDRTRLFSRFERFGRTAGPQPGLVGGLGSKAKPTGTGLGLFLSKYLVEAQGGRIWVESNAELRGEPGATFCFTLPIADVLMLSGTHPNDVARSHQRALPGV